MLLTLTWKSTSCSDSDCSTFCWRTAGAPRTANGCRDDAASDEVLRLGDLGVCFEILRKLFLHALVIEDRFEHNIRLVFLQL